MSYNQRRGPRDALAEAKKRAKEAEAERSQLRKAHITEHFIARKLEAERDELRAENEELRRKLAEAEKDRDLAETRIHDVYMELDSCKKALTRIKS